jgi:hypothetical protein
MLFGRKGPVHRIALRSEYNRHYLCAETSAQQARMYANRIWQNAQETFLLEELGDGSVTLKCEANGRWVNGDPHDGGFLKANQPEVHPGEKFLLHEIGDRIISLQSLYIKQTAGADHGYVSAAMDGDAGIRANRTWVREWERFRLDFVTAYQPVTSPPNGLTRKFIPAGDWVTLESGWNYKAVAQFKEPKGAIVGIDVGGPLGIGYKKETLDGVTIKRLEVAGESMAGAKLIIKVLYPTTVEYGWGGVPGVPGTITIDNPL